MGRVTFIYKNDTSIIQDIYVEPWPKRYTMRPGEVLAMAWDPSKDDPNTVEMIVHEEGITFWLNFEGDELEITIDGKPAEKRDWAN